MNLGAELIQGTKLGLALERDGTKIVVVFSKLETDKIRKVLK